MNSVFIVIWDDDTIDEPWTVTHYQMTEKTMKTRNGFVSNSSSSSYVLFANKKYFDATLKKFNDIMPIIHEYKNERYLKKIKFLGKDIMVLSDWTDAGGGGPEIELEGIEDEDRIDKMWDRFYEFRDALEKNKKKCYVEKTDL